MFALAGGVALSIGNLSSQYAWPFVGLSVTEVLVCSIIVVIGLDTRSVLSYSDYICVDIFLVSDGIPPSGALLFFFLLFVLLLKAQP